MQAKRLFLVSALISVFVSFAHAEGGGGGGHGTFGINGGLGIPFLTQAGVNIYFTDNVGLDVDYGLLSIKSGETKLELNMPSAMLKWHPMAGNFYVAGGVGQETLTATATSAMSNQTAEIKVTAMTAIAKVGWMWGANNGGLWFGMDISYIAPSGAKTTINSTLPATSQEYKDAQADADKFGKSSYMNFTFARLGFLF